MKLTRFLLSTSTLSIISRMISAVANFISIKYIIEVLGLEGYGAYVVLSGFIGWYMLSDLGIGWALQNYISRLRVKGESEGEGVLVAFFATVLCGCFFFFVSVVVGYNYSDALLSEYPWIEGRQAFLAFTVVAFLSILTAIGSLGYKVWYSKHQGHLSNLFPALSSLLGLGAIFMISEKGNPASLVNCLFLYYLPGAILSWVCLGYHLIITRSQVRCGLFECCQKHFPNIWEKSKGLFFFAFLTCALINSEPLFLSWCDGVEAATYGVLIRVLNVFLWFFNACLVVAWPVCSEAMEQRNRNKVFKVIRIHILGGLGAMSLYAVMLYFGISYLTNVISPDEAILIDPVVFMIFVLYGLIRVVVDATSVFMQSMDLTKPFYVLLPVQIVIVFLLQVLFAKLEYGIMGVIGAYTLSFAVVQLWANPLFLKRYIKEVR